jgi:MerR family redox-sensitive transcriptional activator SoxR
LDMFTLLTISEVSRRSGVAASALRFYEGRGLIKSVRTGSGHRRYPRAVLRRIAFIVFAQRIGLSLEEVGAELAKLPQDLVPEGSGWAKLSGGWTHRIEERMAEFQACGRGSPNALAAVACRCTDVSSRTRATVPPATALGRVTGSAIPRRPT